MSLGTTISRLRAEKKLSQGDLSDALEVSRQSVSKWETDASVPELDKLIKLSQLFGVTLDELVTGETPKEPATLSPSPSLPRQMPGQKIAAIILVCMAFLVWLFLTVLGVPLEGLILATPLLVCAAICFAAKKRAGLWCAWAIYLTVELYLRWATGLTWRLTLRTFVFTPEENYTRLVIAWVQLLVLLLMFFFTFRSFRNIHLDLHSRRNRFLLAGGWVLLILLHLLKNWGYPIIYQNPAMDFSLGIRLLLRAGDVLLLALFAALLTATVCALRKPRD